MMDNEEDAEELKLLEELRQKQKEIEETLARKRAERLAKEKEAARNKPLVIYVKSINDNRTDSFAYLRASNPDHPKLSEIFPQQWHAGKESYYQYLSGWLDFVGKVASFENVTIVYQDTTKETISEYLQPWAYQVDIGERYLIMKWNIKTYPRYELTSIPGAASKGRIYNFPLQEAWRVYNILQSEEEKGLQVIYTDSAKSFILEQLQKREELNTIAQKEVYEPYLMLDMNGYRLKPFQTVALRFQVLADGRFLDADEMGLGKTLVALAYYKLRLEDGEKLSTLVVCPAHLVYNWYREIKKFLGQDIRIAVFRGLVPSDFDMARMLDKSEYDIGIISYNIVGKEHEIAGDININKEGYKVKDEDYKEPLWARLVNIARFDYIIVDEAHYISNSDSGRSKAVRGLNSRYLAELSGTPLVNRPPDLWPILHLHNRNQFPSEGTFVSTYTIGDRKTPRNVQELRELMKTIMIRRRKIDVIKDLPPIERIPYYHELSPKAQRVYNKALLGIYQYIDSLGNQWEKSITNILAKINRLKQVCAIDKTSTTADLATELYDQSEGDTYRRTLIFSYFHDTTYKIKTLLSPEAISFLDITSGGNTKLVSVPERMARSDKFSRDESVHHLVAPLMSTQEGLNITAAGFTIFNDMWWSPKTHHQAEGRAYGRISDPHSVTSYYVLAKGTVDEYIYELNEEKQATFDEIVEGTEVDRQDSIAKRLIEKLREDMFKLKRGDKKDNGF